MGDITIYFLHDTITPGNARMVWRDQTTVPRVGEVVDIQIISQARTVPSACVVTRVHWTTRTSVEVSLTTEVRGG